MFSPMTITIILLSASPFDSSLAFQLLGVDKNSLSSSFHHVSPLLFLLFNGPVITSVPGLHEASLSPLIVWQRGNIILYTLQKPARASFSGILVEEVEGVQVLNPEQVRLNVLTKLQEAIEEEAILEEQILALMHRFADRFTDRRVEINNLMVLHNHPLIDYGKYALGCMTGADMKKCVHLKSVGPCFGSI
ncbi:hypothetical protein Tco_1247443 [Tanacetum coccineum]